MMPRSEELRICRRGSAPVPGNEGYVSREPVPAHKFKEDPKIA